MDPQIVFEHGWVMQLVRVHCLTREVHDYNGKLSVFFFVPALVRHEASDQLLCFFVLGMPFLKVTFKLLFQ